LKSRDREIGRALDPLLDLLAFEHAVLFEKTPSQPQERGQRYDGNPDD
jgi:hypothetical protein